MERNSVDGCGGCAGAWLSYEQELRTAQRATCRDTGCAWRVDCNLDDDLQHPPEELPKLLTKLAEGYDVVYGPPEKEQHGFFRDTASQITKMALQDAMGAETARHVSAFRVFRTELRGAFAEYKSPSVNLDVLLTWATTRFTALPVRHESRKYGESGYTTRKLLLHAMNMMTGFSTMPYGISGRVFVDWVAGCAWTRWPNDRGIRTQHLLKPRRMLDKAKAACELRQRERAL